MWDFCFVCFILLNNCMIRFWALLIIKCGLSKLAKANPQQGVVGCLTPSHLYTLTSNLVFSMQTHVRDPRGPIWFLDLNQIATPKKRENRSCNSQVRGSAPTPMSTFYCFCFLITIIKKSTVLKSERSNKKWMKK